MPPVARLAWWGQRYRGERDPLFTLKVCPGLLSTETPAEFPWVNCLPQAMVSSASHSRLHLLIQAPGGGLKGSAGTMRQGLTRVPPSWPSDLCGCRGSDRILLYLCSRHRLGEPNPTRSVLWFQSPLWAPYSLLLLTSRSCPDTA